MDENSTGKPASNGLMKRRGLMAAVAGISAAALSKLVNTPSAQAASGDPILIDSISNNGTGLTQLNGSSFAVKKTGAGTIGIAGFGDTGVQGQGFSGPCVFASSSGAGDGVQVFTGAGVGVRILANNGGSPAGIGVISGSTNNYAVQAQSNNTNAVVATTLGGTTAAIGVNGITFAGTAIQGDITSGGTGIAGQFNGRVNITGNTVLGANLTVGGNLVVTGTKSAAVKDNSGAYRLVYCVEAPQSWFQDFGVAQMPPGGRTTVQLNPSFVQTVVTSDYHVVLTEYGTQNSGLYVASRGPTSFEVRANSDKDATSFGYMVVAMRKDVSNSYMPVVPENVVFPNPQGNPTLDKPPTINMTKSDGPLYNR